MNPSGQHPGRIFVIGLDGATFDLITPWVAEGRLPHLASLLDNGTHGELSSTIHPLTAAAWTSFMTGKNPGKHGVYDFITRVPGSYDIQLVNSRTRDPETLWRILGSHGKQVGVINIPLNYPPEPINGFLVSWMDAPGTQSRYTHPPELAAELKVALGEYCLTVNFNSTLDQYAKDLFAMVDNRAAAITYLMENKPWDLFVSLFSATDFVQHAFWKYMDETHPHYDVEGAVKYGTVIRDIYEKIDEKIGSLLARLDEKDVVIIMSDHGAGPLKGVVNLNRWLQMQGLLQFSEGTGAAFSGILLKVLTRVKAAIPVTVKDFIKQRLPSLRDRMESHLFLSYLDWPRTQAFALGAYGNIWINLKGREPQGVVAPGGEYETLMNQIERGLMALSFNGELMVEKVHRKHEIYSGPYLERAPDLVVQWKDYAYHSRQRFGESETQLFQNEQTMPMAKMEMNGFHRMNGVFIAKGPGIAPGKKIDGASIMDVAPTILYLMGLPIPESMDGKVLNEIFEAGVMASKPLVRQSETEETGVAAPVATPYSEDEEEMIRQRLKALGYLE